MATVLVGSRSIGWLTAFAVLLAACSGETTTSGTSYRIARSYLPTTAQVEPLSSFAGLGVPVNAVTDHQVTRGVSLDRGDFRIGPPGAASIISLDTATRMVEVAMVNQQASYNPALVTLARVTISVPGDGGASGYRNRLAWVGFLTRRPGGVSCGGQTGPSVTYMYVQPFGAVVVDAQTGKSAITYWSRGTGVCGGSALLGPFLHRAYEVLSVPWTLIGEQAGTAPPHLPPGATDATRANQWVFRYTMPPCGANWDSGGYYRQGKLTGFLIEVQVPMEAPGHCPPARTLTGQFSTAIPARHAPVGILVGGYL